VSVIMPVFDAGRDLEQALRSVAAQTFTDRELVIVDDGSRDPITLAVLEVAARQPGVQLHHTPNGGPSRARNLAIEHARHRIDRPITIGRGLRVVLPAGGRQDFG
jgi:glycosyltransferase involved in cell wall biosynthesis